MLAPPLSSQGEQKEYAPVAEPQRHGSRRSRAPTHGHRAGPARERRTPPRGGAVGFAPQFTARTESRNGVASIALTGELDMATVPVLQEHLAHFEGDGGVAIMLDLRELTFLDCSALRAFLAARDRARTNGHRLILVGAGQPARRLFELTGMEFLLDEQEAVSVLDQFTGGEPRREGQIVGAVVEAHV
jgi:anti-sigma B factor antagonist